MKTMLMQNFGVTNKEHYGMFGIFWSGQLLSNELNIAETLQVFTVLSV